MDINNSINENEDAIEYANMFNRFFNESLDDRCMSIQKMLHEKKDDKKPKNDEKSDNNDENADVGEKSELPADVQKELDDAAAKDPKNASKLKKVGAFLGKMINSASSAVVASMLDNFTLGNMKEAICDIYKKKKLDSMGEDDIDVVGKELREMPEFKKSKKQYVDSGKRQDDNTSTEIDETTIQCRCAWYSKKDDQNVLKILNELVVDIQKQAKAQDDKIKELKSKVKSMKIDGVGDEEVDAFGPIIANMVKDNKPAAEIAKKVKQLKAGVKESYQQKIYKHKHRLLAEGKEPIITESKKKWLMLEAICKNEEYQENLATYLLNEGLMDKFKNLGTSIKNVSSKFTSKIKDASSKALEAVKNGGLAPILKIAGIGLLAVTGAWGIALIISTMMLIEKHGKQLKYAFDYAWSSFANSKGVISQFDFMTKGNDSKYSARFYAKDATWRVINASNQNKHPDKDFAKAILTGGFGKKFINRVVELWDPVFSPEKGGKIDFGELLKQCKAISISDKQLAMLNDFKNQYATLKAGITKPQIDTRTQEL